MFLSFVVVYNKRTEDKEQALPKSTHLSIRRPPTFFYNLSARPPLGQHSQASVDSPLQSLALRNSLAYYTSETTVEGKPALSKKDKKKLGADALYKESERPALSLSFSSKLAAAWLQDSPNPLPTSQCFLSKWGILKFTQADAVRGRATQTRPERGRETPLRSHIHSWERLRGREFRGQTGRRLARFSPDKWVFSVTSGVDWCTISVTSSPSHNTHTHSYSSSSLFRSTDGHTPRDHSPWRRRKREETRGVASVLV